MASETDICILFQCMPDHASPPRTHRYTTSDWLAVPVDLIFGFFCQPKNLPPLMPKWQRTRIDALSLVPPPTSVVGLAVSGAAGKSSRITLSFRPLPFSPLRIRWLALIDEFEWNRRFCDLQLSGPFAYWRHCHEVQAEERHGRQGTLVTDDVQYRLPLGPLDPAVNALGGRAQLTMLFRFRQQELRKFFGVKATKVA
jgi:ligand-binding SRPBCC domain-containing protein